MVSCWMYFKGRINRISWQDVGCGREREKSKMDPRYLV